MAGVIHGHAQHGDPMFQEFMGRLLRRVCLPLFEMVRKTISRFDEFMCFCL
jgi:gamma-tubulin complex component 3